MNFKIISVAVFSLTVVAMIVVGNLPPYVLLRGAFFAPGLPSQVPVRAIMQIALTLMCAAAALVVILSRRRKPEDKNWAYGAMGTLLGFWLAEPGFSN